MRWWRHPAAAAAAAALCLLAAPRARGFAVVQEDVLRVATNQVYDREAIVLCGEAQMDGIARDDLFLVSQKGLMGGRIDLGGRMENDAWALAHTIRLTGRVADHARFFGRVVRIDGEVGSGLFVMGETVKVGSAARIGRNARIVATDVIWEGAAAGGLAVEARSVTISGSVGGDADCRAAEIRLLPAARIGGDLFWSAPAPPTMERSDQVAGRVVERPAAPERGGVLPLFALQLTAFLSALIGGLPAIALFPRLTGEAVLLVRRSFWKCALAGGVLLGALPVLIVLGFLSLFGIPFALSAACGGVILAGYAQVVVALALGAFLLRRRGPQGFGSAAGALALGLAAIHLAVWIPALFLGVFVLVAMVGAGAASLALLRRERAAAAAGDSPAAAGSPAG
jgi:hypothetical protein